MRKPKMAHYIGKVVAVTRFIPDYPLGVGQDTRLLVNAICKNPQRYQLVRDDGREGQWWVDPDAVIGWGQP